MKTVLRNFIIALTLFLSVSVLAGTVIEPSFAKGKKAKITFNKLKHDFGKVAEGVELTYTFKFKNTGSEKLIIHSVNPSCGCTGATLGDKKEYGKNEKGKIKISFNTQGRSGVQTKTVTVQTNDLDRPQVVLTITCEIVG